MYINKTKGDQMKILVAILMALFFVGCANVGLEPKSYSILDLRFVPYEIIQGKMELNKKTYDDFYSKLTQRPDKGWLQYITDTTIPIYKLQLELLKSAQLSIQNNKITRTQKFQSYLDDINNLVKFENHFNKGISEYKQACLKQLDRLNKSLENIFTDKHYFKYNEIYVTKDYSKKWLFIDGKKETKIKKSQIKDKIKFYEDAIKKLDILFTKNYKGDFSIN